MQVHRNGQPVVGFGLGSMSSTEWVATRNRLVDMDRLIATGRGDERVDGGGCTEPGGGIAPTRRTALEMASLLRDQMGAGLGDQEAPAAPEHHSPWKEAIVMSVAGAVTGWVLDEIAHRTFLKRRRR